MHVYVMFGHVDFVEKLDGVTENVNIEIGQVFTTVMVA